MIKFALWIITADESLAERWYRLFSRESLHTIRRHSLAGFAPPPETCGIALIEAGIEGMSKPKDLADFLKGRKDISVIVFSAPGYSSNQLISGFLEHGADDFISSDIDERVLLSKTRAHIRRMVPSINAAKTLITSKSGDISLDKVNRTLKTCIGSKREKAIEGLTPKEFDIFSLLLAHEGEIVSRSYLMEEIWKDKSGKVNCETIDKHVENLRNKVGDCGGRIKTIYGSGYIYKGGE